MPSEQEFVQLYDKLISQGSLEFYSTSFLRGQTFDRSIIIVDEASNMIFQELDTIMTRVGQDSRICFAGDIGDIIRSGLVRSYLIAKTNIARPLQ